MLIKTKTNENYATAVVIYSLYYSIKKKINKQRKYSETVEQVT